MEWILVSYMKYPQDSWELYTFRNTASLDFKGQRKYKTKCQTLKTLQKLADKAIQQQYMLTFMKKQSSWKTEYMSSQSQKLQKNSYRILKP